MTAYQPPVGFYFSVAILGKNDKPFPPADASFQEVSGLTVTMDTETIKEGGQNRFAHTVPSRTNYDNLVLKRGLMVRRSTLASWCTETLDGGLNKKIKPRTIMVSLLDANADNEGAIMIWKFVNAYPVKWEVSALDAAKSEIVVESITFAYAYFERQKAPAAKNYPK